MKIESKYDLKDVLYIPAFNKEGEVVGFTFDRSGMTYKVRYISDDNFKYEWFYEDELQDKKNKKMGFND